MYSIGVMSWNITSLYGGYKKDTNTNSLQMEYFVSSLDFLNIVPRINVHLSLSLARSPLFISFSAMNRVFWSYFVYFIYSCRISTCDICRVYFFFFICCACFFQWNKSVIHSKHRPGHKCLPRYQWSVFLFMDLLCEEMIWSYGVL